MEVAPAFSVVCSKYQERGGLPDADVFTWWQQHPSLKDYQLLTALAHAQRDGAVRPTAVAIVVSDTKWHADKKSFRWYRKWANWTRDVAYDERELCAAKGHGPKMCGRAKGEFHVSLIEIARFRREGGAN